MNAHVFSILKDILQTMPDEGGVCCLMLDKMSIRSLTVMEALRKLEATTDQAILRIMPWSSCFVVYVKSGSNQLLSI